MNDPLDPTADLVRCCVPAVKKNGGVSDLYAGGALKAADQPGLRVTTKYPLWVLSKLPKGGPPTHPIWTQAVREKTTHPPHYPTRARGAGVRARDV